MVLTDVPDESMLERCPWSGLLGLANFRGVDLPTRQGLMNPLENNTNSMSLLMFTT